MVDWNEVYENGDDFAQLSAGELDEIFDAVPILRSAKPVRVLEVGCGRGALARELARRGCAVTARDPSEPAIRHAIAQDPGGLTRYEVATGVGTVADGYNVVVAKYVYPFVGDKVAFVRDALRALAPDGYLVILHPRYRTCVVDKGISMYRWRIVRAVRREGAVATAFTQRLHHVIVARRPRVS